MCLMIISLLVRTLFCFLVFFFFNNKLLADNLEQQFSGVFSFLLLV